MYLYNIIKYISIYTLSERSLVVVTKLTQHFLMAVYVFYKPKIYLQQYRIVCNCDWWLPWLHKPKIYLQQYRIVCNCDWWLPWLHKAIGRSGREDAFWTHCRVLHGYRFFQFSRVYTSIGVNPLTQRILALIFTILM